MQDFLSGSKNSLLRNMVSYKSDSNTVAALSWRLQYCLQKDCSHPSYIFLKKRKFWQSSYVCIKVSFKLIYIFPGKRNSLWMHWKQHGWLTLNCFTFIFNFLKCVHLRYGLLAITVYDIFCFLFPKTNPDQNLRLNPIEMVIFVQHCTNNVKFVR